MGGAMGLTPARPRGRNLVIAKAKSAAETAAARLDQLNPEDQQPVGERTRSNTRARKTKDDKQATADRGHVEASAYQAGSRESMLLYQRTEQLFSDEKGECKDEGKIWTICPRWRVRIWVNTRPKAMKNSFITPEGTPDADPDYELTEETEGTDGGEEGEDEMDGGPGEADWQQTVKTAARETRAQEEREEAQRRAEAEVEARSQAKARRDTADKAAEVSRRKEEKLGFWKREPGRKR